MRLEPRSLVGMLPSPLVVRARNALSEDAVSLIVRMWRKLMPVQNHFRFCECRDEAAHRRPVAAKGGMRATEDLVNVKSVNMDERPFQELPRDLEADEAQIGWGREGGIRKFADVKSKFSPDMPVRTLIIGDAVAKFFPQLWKFNRCGRIDRFRMTQRVAQVMR